MSFTHFSRLTPQNEHDSRTLSEVSAASELSEGGLGGGGEHFHELEECYANLELLLHSPDPIRHHAVDVSTSFYSWGKADNGSVRMHMVLKFYYHIDLLEVIGVDPKDIDAARRAPKDAFIRTKRGKSAGWFPYCLFNAISEDTISWSVQKHTADGDIFERLEMFVTLAMTHFADYFPFVFRVLPVKIGVDTWPIQNRILMRPRYKQNGEPDWNIGAFFRETEGLELRSEDDAHTLVMLDPNAPPGKVHTRVYQIFVFHSEAFEQILKFIGISLGIVVLFVFYPAFTLEKDAYDIGEVIGAASTTVLADVALLFVVPDEGGFTVAEKVIVLHCFFIVALCAMLCCGLLNEWWYIVSACVFIAGVTLAIVLQGWFSYNQLYKRLRHMTPKFKKVGDFKLADRII